MQFKRFLAILLLLLLPLQSTLAAIDSCCIAEADGQMAEASAPVEPSLEASPALADGEADCCTICDFCNHSSFSFAGTPQNPHVCSLTCAPAPPPDLRIDSFIPDVPPRPDRAA